MLLDQLRAKATVPVGDGFTTWPPPLGTLSVTLEDAEFLYALVRVTKPTLVVESGTGLGVSARFIAEALRENGRGELVSFESENVWASQAMSLLAGLPAEVIVGGCDEAALEPDLVLVDSHPGRRARDIAYWLTNGYRGLVVVHDAMRQYDQFSLGDGVLLPGSDGLWIGRGR